MNIVNSKRRIDMRRGYLRQLLLVIVGLSALAIWARPAFSVHDILTENTDFQDPDAGAWNFINDYTGMIGGDTVDWIWTKPQADLSSYKTVEVPEFKDLWKETDPLAEDLLTQHMKDALSDRLGLKVVDKNADITVNGAIVDYSSGTIPPRYWPNHNPTDSLVEVEVSVVDNKTKEIISKVRHQSIDPTIEAAIAETVNDMMDQWAKK
jgi:hypothetical protein